MTSEAPPHGSDEVLGDEHTPSAVLSYTFKDTVAPAARLFLYLGCADQRTIPWQGLRRAGDEFFLAANTTTGRYYSPVGRGETSSYCRCARQMPGKLSSCGTFTRYRENHGLSNGAAAEPSAAAKARTTIC